MSAQVSPEEEEPVPITSTLGRMAALSTKGAGLIASSLTMSSKVRGMSRKERLSRKPVTMTPSSKQVFHLLTTQTEKQEVFDAIKGRMSVHGEGSGHGGHKSAISKKAGFTHMSQAAIDTSWVFDQHWVINPRSYQRKAWDIMLTLLVFYLISILPWQLGVPFYHAPPELYTFDTVLEVIFWLDMFATLNTGFIHAGEVELDRTEIVEHYLSTWFLVDFIGNFPFYAFIGKRGGKGFKLLKWLKLNKLFRIGKLVRYLRDYVKFASVIKYSSALIVFLHVSACMAVGELFGHHDLLFISYWDMYWHALTQVVSLAVGGNIGSNVITIDTAAATAHRRYLATVSNTTEYVTAATDDHSTFQPLDERSFTNELALSIIVVGTILLIFLSASIVVILSNRSNTTMKFKLKIENMKTELEYYDIDELLADRVMEFYDYLWFNQLNSDENSVHKDSMLSAELRRELILTIYSDMLTSTPFLTACSEDCVASVANHVVNTIAMPADFIIRKKDIGRELFIIKKGMVGVFNDLQYLKSLQKGQFFGEVALLGEKKHRTATVRAISVCELCVLYANDFANISSEYPELLVNMTQYMNATHLDADLVKNPKLMTRRKTNLGEQIKAAKAEKGTPKQRKSVEAMLAGGQSPGFLAGMQNLSSRALGSVRSSLMSPGMMSRKSSLATPAGPTPQRNLSVGAQMAGLLADLQAAETPSGHNTTDGFSPNSRIVEKDDNSLGFTKAPPTADDVRGMISGLLNARLHPQQEEDEDEDEDDDYDYAKPGTPTKPSDIMNFGQDSQGQGQQLSPVNASEMAVRMQADHEAEDEMPSPGLDPLLIHTSTSNLNKDVSRQSVQREKIRIQQEAKARSIAKLNAEANATTATTQSTTLEEAQKESKKDKQTIEELEAMVNNLKGSLESTNKSLEELSKVVIITHAAATNEGRELVDKIVEKEKAKEKEATLSAGTGKAGSMRASPNTTFDSHSHGNGMSNSRDRTASRERDANSPSYNKKKKKKDAGGGGAVSHVHLGTSGSIYAPENETEIFTTPSQEFDGGFASRHTVKMRRAPAADSMPVPVIVKVPSVDSVDLHMADLEADAEAEALAQAEAKEKAAKEAAIKAKLKEEKKERQGSLSFSFQTPKIFSSLSNNSYNSRAHAADAELSNIDPKRESPVDAARKDKSAVSDIDAVTEF